MGWNVAIAAVVIVGVVLVIFTRSNDTSSAGTGPPRAANPATGEPGDHWHSYLGVNICGAVARPRSPAFETPVGAASGVQNAGIHSHGDGLIHTHPFVNAEEGNNATLGKYASYGDWSVSSDSIDAWTGPKGDPGQTSWSNGDTCPFGEVQGREGRDRLGGRRRRRAPATRATTGSATARRSRSASCPRAPRSNSRPTRARPSPTSPTRTWLRS